MLFVFDDLLGDGAADCEAGSDAVVLEVGVLPQVGVATLIAGQASASMTPASTRVLRVVGQAVPAAPPSLPEWALMWEDELLERIASTSATNIEAGLRDRVRELRDRGMSWARIGIALGMRRQSA